MTPLFAFISVPTMIVLGVVAVLIFGRRLPEIAKALGKSITDQASRLFSKRQPMPKNSVNSVQRACLSPSDRGRMT